MQELGEMLPPVLPYNVAESSSAPAYASDEMLLLSWTSCM